MPSQKNIYCPQCNTWMVVPDTPEIMNQVIACPTCRFQAPVSAFRTTPLPAAPAACAQQQTPPDTSKPEPAPASDSSSVPASEPAPEPSPSSPGKNRGLLVGIIAGAILLAVLAALLLYLNANPKVFSTSNETNDEGDGNAEIVGTVGPQTIYGHEAVDLGLPSGLKWATCNLGAYSPSSYGQYYAWGETSVKSSYNKHNYSHSWEYDHDINFTKYTYYDYLTTLEQYDDAAFVNWGGSWHMPSPEDFNELRSYCTWTWTIKDGVSGYEVSSRSNGGSIFLPAAGYYNRGELTESGSVGYYWTSSVSAEIKNAKRFCFRYGAVLPDEDWNGARYFGRTIRPVSR